MAEVENVKNQTQWISDKAAWALVVAFLALIVSGYQCYDTHLNADVEAYLGKQIRLYVVKDWEGSNKPKPVILASISCMNAGGRSIAYTDIKLRVMMESVSSTRHEMSFEAARQIHNMLMGDADSKLDPVGPVLALGRQACVAQYAFALSDDIQYEIVPDSFFLTIELWVQVPSDEWEYLRAYRSAMVRDIWRGIPDGQPYNDTVVAIKELSLF